MLKRSAHVFRYKIMQKGGNLIMNIHFEPVTSHNREEILRLRVSEEQKDFIETVEECLKDRVGGR